MQQWRKLVEWHDLVAIQETHGNDMDILTMDREAPTHLHYISTIDERYAGGVLTSVKKDFIRDNFESIFSYTVVEGRILRVRADGASGNLDIFNVHLDPNLSIPELREVLRNINDCMDRNPLTITMIVGDVNCPMASDPKLYIKDDSLLFTPSKFGRIFDEAFYSFTDIAGDYYTHRATLHDGNVVLSKIDRCLIDLQPADLCDRHCSAKVLADVYAADYCSDHVPVSFTIR